MLLVREFLNPDRIPFVKTRELFFALILE